MDGIKIEVTGNIARVTERPGKITSGTVGLPVSFSFDGAWDGLRKVFVFGGGKVVKAVEDATVVPWEVLEEPGAWLSVGAYGINADGTIAIPTIWANVCPIQTGVDPDADPSTDPTAPIWQTMMQYFTELSTKPSAKIADVTLFSSAWVGSDSPYAQVVAIDGVTKSSQVDLKPNAQQLELLHEKDLVFVTENEGGVVTVYAIGDKPTGDWTLQVSIMEAVV